MTSATPSRLCLGEGLPRVENEIHALLRDQTPDDQHEPIGLQVPRGEAIRSASRRDRHAVGHDLDRRRVRKSLEEVVAERFRDGDASLRNVQREPFAGAEVPPRQATPLRVLPLAPVDRHHDLLAGEARDEREATDRERVVVHDVVRAERSEERGEEAVREAVPTGVPETRDPPDPHAPVARAVRTVHGQNRDVDAPPREDRIDLLAMT